MIRPKHTTLEFEPIFSDFNYYKIRVELEQQWFLWLVNRFCNKQTAGNLSFSKFSRGDFDQILMLEKQTGHDVKAIELFVASQFSDSPIHRLVHFGLTSEDINNVAYAVVLDNSKRLVVKSLDHFIGIDFNSSRFNHKILARTHGQPATITTMSSQLEVFQTRIKNQVNKLSETNFGVKFGGAIGDWSDLAIALGVNNKDVQQLCRDFVISNTTWFGSGHHVVDSLLIEKVVFETSTTQISNRESIINYLSQVKILNQILYDMAQDLWLYISNGTLVLANNDKVGSSVMPQKINPIDLERSMAAVKTSNSYIDLMVDNLTVSRLQRDLSDSYLMRRLGGIFEHFDVALSSILKTLPRLSVDFNRCSNDIEDNPEIAGSAIQACLRLNAVGVFTDISFLNKELLCKVNPYFLLKGITQGESKTDMWSFVKDLNLLGVLTDSQTTRIIDYYCLQELTDGEAIRYNIEDLINGINL